MSVVRATASLVALAFATVAGAQQPAKHETPAAKPPAKTAPAKPAAHDSTKHAAPGTAAAPAGKPSHDSTKHAPAKPAGKKP
ncbi:MAG TPA: hypothetical protein VGE27_10915 [Gemmatimonas sp.]|uniref:hypothetical protein n=1 Tax=Gemmatimonas sp. TaxID=1962908 RepID=UPI002ED99AC9